MNKQLKTKRRLEIERTHEAVYREYLQLMEKGAMKCKAYEYIAMYPEKLIMPCILAGCPEGGIVYDPFGGAATTALATIHSLGNRNFILSELSPEYAEISRKRIEPELNQLTLF